MTFVVRIRAHPGVDYVATCETCVASSTSGAEQASKRAAAKAFQRVERRLVGEGEIRLRRVTDFTFVASLIPDGEKGGAS